MLKQLLAIFKMNGTSEKLSVAAISTVDTAKETDIMLASSNNDRSGLSDEPLLTFATVKIPKGSTEAEKGHDVSSSADRDADANRGRRVLSKLALHEERMNDQHKERMAKSKRAGSTEEFTPDMPPRGPKLR
jgi:phage protein D